MSPEKNSVYRFGIYEFDARGAELRRNGTRIKLQEQSRQVLVELLEHPGEIVTREDLRSLLWNRDTFVDFETGLNTIVKRLRQALGDSADNPTFIETIPRKGYRFITPVETLALPTYKTDTRQRKNRLRLLAITVGIFGILFFGVLLLSFRSSSPTMPHIAASHRLTDSGYFKSSLVTDGKTLYYWEKRPTGFATMHLSVNGGEPSELTSFPRGFFRGISPDGSELLLWVTDPKTGVGEAWIQPLPGGTARLVVNNARWPVWTSDGTGILFARNDRVLFRASADGTNIRQLAKLPDISGISVSPDGQRIRIPLVNGKSLSYNFDLWELGVDGSNPHTVGEDSLSGGRWSPDGRYYFFRLWDGEKSNLWVAPGDAESSRRGAPKATQLTFGPMHIGSPREVTTAEFDKSGKRLYTIGTEPRGELSVYDSNKKTWVPYLSGISACYVDFSRDGQWIAYVSYPDGSLWRSRVDGTERMQLTRPPMAVLNPRWSPDGTLIAFNNMSTGSLDHRLGSMQAYIVNRDGGGPQLLAGGPSEAADPAWSLDGSTVAYNTNFPPELRLLNLKTQKSQKIVGSDGMFSARWSPDGKYIVALAKTDPLKLMLLTVATGQWEELASGALGWPNFSRDSRTIDFYCFPSLCRVDVATHAKTEVTDVRNFPHTSFVLGSAGWFGIAPDGRPVSTRDTATYEIYAFDLDYR